jgi:HlyD family secretion protein
VALPPQQGGRFQMPEVTDQQCAAVTAALAKKPNETKQLDALREKMRAPDADRAALRDEQQRLYAAIGVDARTAAACRFRDMRAQGGATDAAGRSQRSAGNGDQPGAAPRAQTPGSQLQIGTPERGASGRSIRAGVVFVRKGTSWEPRPVMLGAGNFDYTEVVTGLEEGEEVALLASLAMQAQREQQSERFRSMTGSGVPGMGGTPGGGAARSPARR